MAGSISSNRGQGSAQPGWSGVGRFLRWWGRELAELVPTALRPLPRSTARFLWAESGPDTIALWRLIGGRRQEVKRLALASMDAPALKLAFDEARRAAPGLSLGVCVPAEQVLRRDLFLPAAARENPRQVVGFEMGRHTPFHADQAYFDCRLGVSNGKAGQLGVSLTVTPRVSVESTLRRLREWELLAWA